MKVTTDEPASERLLSKASAVMAMEPDKSPANSLRAEEQDVEKNTKQAGARRAVYSAGRRAKRCPRCLESGV